MSFRVVLALVFFVSASVAATLVSCTSGDNPLVAPDGGAFDASGFDAAGYDAAWLDGALGDAFTPGDDGGGGDATADAGPTYNDMTQAQLWSSFDTTTVDAGAKGFEGSVFDGRYVYLFPYTGGTTAIVTRYDTQATFDVTTSWSTFDTTTLVPSASGFAGGAFDGRYVYLAPRAGQGNVVARYDTQADFGTGGSWSSFKTTSVDAAASGFVGAVFDGRYVYFVPYNNASNVYHGVVTRYDTTGAFTDAGAWLTFDVAAKVDPNAKGFYGGVFDGRYLYLVPWINANGPTYSGVVARYDTQAPFDTQGSWVTFDATKRDANAKGFSGGAFDGRYLYLVPASASSVAVRYDTTADFSTAGSWTTFDLAGSKAGAYGFTGATFDGRYVYFAPYSNTTYDGLAARYDTQAAFDVAGSWQTYDTSAKGVGFIGNVFDGRYVYFVPCTNGSFDGQVVRFDAKSPPSMPSLYGTSPVKFNGSFL